MALIDDTETLLNLDVPASQRNQPKPAPAPEPVVRSSVNVVSERRDFLATDSARWSWSQLRDYVVNQIESRNGPIPNRNAAKEASIFRRFLGTFGPQAGPIAEYAFTVCDGKWKGAPISINRFCANSDDYFAAVIKRRLADRT